MLGLVRHDVYHLPAYVQLCAGLEGGTPCLVTVEEETYFLAVPLIVRHIPGSEGSSDAASPYGYPGPLVGVPAGADPGDIDVFLDEAIQALLEELRTRKITSLFVRFNTLLTVPLSPFVRRGTLVSHGPTVSMDLSLPRQTLENNIRPGHRRQIRNTIQLGATVEQDEEWRTLDEFVAVYQETMRRVNAQEQYFFSTDYFSRLREHLRGHVHLFIVRFRDRVAGGGIFTEHGGIVQYHLGATSGEFLNLHPVKLLLYAVAFWAQERGNYTFHLGGGVGAHEDSLFHFKAGFSNTRHQFYTWRAVCDAKAYGDLIESWRCRHGRAPAGPEAFFPAYRQIPEPICPGAKSFQSSSPVAADDDRRGKVG